MPLIQTPFRAMRILAVLAVCFAAPAFADQGPYPQTEEEKQAAYDALVWQSTPQSYALDRSHAHVKLSQDRVLLLGSDARRLSWLISGVEFPDTEAVLSLPAAGAPLVYYEWREEGYVSDSDWADVDADALLAQHKEGTEQSNEERVKNGFKPMHVVGWIQAPHYDAETRTVTYALELMDDDSHWANAVALRLGRMGYAEVTWAGSMDKVQQGQRPELLQAALDVHEFDEGHRYTDFKDGDKVAAYGIGGLLATALGLKFGKGIIAAIIAFLLASKKIVIPAVLLGGGAIFSAFRKFFGRNRSS